MSATRCLSARLLLGVEVALAVVLGTSCRDGHTATAPSQLAHPVASVTVTPADTVIDVGQSVRFVAQPRDASGASLTGRTIRWTSANSSVAAVAMDGQVSAIAPGATVIMATIDGKVGSAAIVVQLPLTPVAVVQLTPSDTSLESGASMQLRVTLKDQAGNVLEARSVSWSSANVGVATVSNTGLVSALAPGTSIISAKVGDRSGTASVAVRSPAGSFALVTPPGSMNITSGGHEATAAISVARMGGFNGHVAISVTGVPPGMSIALKPNAVVGSGATLAVQAGANTTTQRVDLVITGTSIGMPAQSATVPVIVTTSSLNGNVTLNFSACDGPAWVAAQDGDGAWSEVVRQNGVYRFNIASGRGGYAVAWDGEYSGRYFTLTFATQAELAGEPQVFCTPADAKLRVHGTAVGFTSLSDVATVSLGGSGVSGLGYLRPNFTLYNVFTGRQDLVAYRTGKNGPGNSDVAIIVRDLDVPVADTVETVDFAGNRAFAPVAAQLRVSGARDDDAISYYIDYLTGARCAAGGLYGVSDSRAVSHTMYGIPAARQRATDLHRVWITAHSDTLSGRAVVESFHQMADRTIRMGPPLLQPTVTMLPAPYARLQAAVTLPMDYQSSASLNYWTDQLSGAISATYGWLGQPSATLAIPDFTMVGGWYSEWVAARDAIVNWSVDVRGSNTAVASMCTEGASTRIAWIMGTTSAAGMTGRALSRQLVVPPGHRRPTPLFDLFSPLSLPQFLSPVRRSSVPAPVR